MKSASNVQANSSDISKYSPSCAINRTVLENNDGNEDINVYYYCPGKAYPNVHRKDNTTYDYINQERCGKPVRSVRRDVLKEKEEIQNNQELKANQCLTQ